MLILSIRKCLIHYFVLKSITSFIEFIIFLINMSTFFLGDNVASNNNLLIITLALTLAIIVGASPMISCPQVTHTVTSTVSATVTEYIPCTPALEPVLTDSIALSGGTNYLIVVSLILAVVTSGFYVYLSVFINGMPWNGSMVFVSWFGTVCASTIINLISTNLSKWSTNWLVDWFIQNIATEMAYLFLEMLYLNKKLFLFVYYGLSLFYHFTESIPFLELIGNDGLIITRTLVIISLSIKLIYIVLSSV